MNNFLLVHHELSIEIKIKPLEIFKQVDIGTILNCITFYFVEYWFITGDAHGPLRKKCWEWINTASCITLPPLLQVKLTAILRLPKVKLMCFLSMKWHLIMISKEIYLVYTILD
jgi:hypothetical protein